MGYIGCLYIILAFAVQASQPTVISTAAAATTTSQSPQSSTSSAVDGMVTVTVPKP